MTIKNFEPIINSSPTKENIDFIWQKIRDYNVPYLGRYSPSYFTIYLKNENSEIIAAILGKLFIKPYASIEVCWVDSHYRNLKLGTRLVQDAEKFIQEQGYKIVQLDTYTWQARPFYEKLGYECVGTLSKWLHEYDRYFMQKNL